MTESKMKTGWIQHSLEEVKAILEKNGGLIMPSAKELGIEKNSLYYRIHENPELEEWWAQCKENTKDKAESVLYKKIDEESLDAVKFYLSHVARDRGYGESQDVRMISANYNMNLDLSLLSDEELNTLNAILEKSTKPNTSSD